MTLIGDASDKEIKPHEQKKISGWSIERWIDYLVRHPEANVPSGVAGQLARMLRDAHIS